MIYHLRNVRYWADFLQKAAISVARRLGMAVPQSSMALGTASSVLRWLAGVFATCSATCSAQSTPRLTVNHGER